ncbi:MAG: HD domain-containing protein, partial [Clostridia bacterium]|nr:HD domain-containing protein [Clostridia bacterium]
IRMGIEIANFHHERWDGRGYPEGLKGKDIPLSARIMAIADVYDALRSDRPYKKAMSHEEVVEIMERDIGSHFDPEIGKIFLESQNEFEDIYKRLKE